MIAGFCAAETAPCDEPRDLFAETPGPSSNHINPEPARAAGSNQRREEPPMGTHPAEAGRCCAHRTDLLACLATGE